MTELPLAASPTPPPSISHADFLDFRDFFYRKTGVHFDDGKRYFVDRRLVERIAATGVDDFRAYFMLLRFEPAGLEMQQLVNLMTVNETYFFREAYQLRCLVDSILREVAEGKAGEEPRLRIWSVPCSTGEEPYSLAIYLLEHWPLANDWEIEIVASDIDTRVLQAARRGVYGARSLQNLPPALRAKYFSPSPEHTMRICPELRESVDFCQVNVSDAAQVAGQGAFDVIFCRNLLIYFDELSRRQVADSLFDALRPGGFLCLGHSESMSRISSLFRIRRFPEAVVYQRPA